LLLHFFHFGFDIKLPTSKAPLNNILILALIPNLKSKKTHNLFIMEFYMDINLVLNLQ